MIAIITRSFNISKVWPNGWQIITFLSLSSYIYIFGFYLLEAIFKVKSYKERDHKRAVKDTIKLLFKNGYHGSVIKVMANTIKGPFKNDVSGVVERGGEYAIFVKKL